MSRVCIKCSRELVPDAKFCRHCGTPASTEKKRCKNCTNVLLADAAFCRGCGKAVEKVADSDQAAQRIQSVWRGKSTRKQLTNRHGAASYLQTIARGFLGRRAAKWQRDYNHRVEEAVHYQSRHERRLAQLKEEKRRLLGLDARKAVQHADRRQDDAAIKIQAMLRKKNRSKIQQAQEMARKDQEAATLRIQRM
jgi:RNA polymerase subunit RPABC4/transcription elongation factor Spt4